MSVVACVVALGAVARPVAAQRPDSTRADSLRVTADSTPSFQRLGPETIGGRPPISARRAFLYSLLVPGLGQARLDRPHGGALFATVELGAILMAAKSLDDLRYAERASRGPLVENWALDTLTDGTVRLVPADTALNRYADDRVRARRLHFEDWIAVLAFNHLFAGADAFVAAQLWDMPLRTTVRAIGPRAAMVGARLEFGRRAPR